MQIHSELNSSVPECGKLIYSYVDDPEKYKHKKPKSKEVAQWKNQVVQEKYKKQKCQAHVRACSGKKSQQTKFIQSKKPKSYMWSDEPEIKYKKKNQVSMEEHQKGQVPICIDQNSQEKKNINMWPVTPETNNDVMQLPKPEVPDEYRYRRLYKDQTYQSTRCYKKHSDPVKRQKMQYKHREEKEI